MQSTSDISSLIDGFFFGFIVSTVLLGFTIVQGWIYMQNNHDKWPIRVFVALILLLDVAETCCSTELLRHYLIKHFGDFHVLQFSSSVLAADFAITGMVMFLVHIFFASRLFLLGKKLWLPGLIVFCSMGIIGLCISIIVVRARTSLITAFVDKELKIQLTIFHFLGVFVDSLVTIGLTVALSPGKTEVKRTKMVLHRFLVYFTTRGILITLVQIGHIVMYLVNPSNLFFWISLHLALSKLYVITTLVILNSRLALGEQLNEATVIGSIPLSFATPDLTVDTDDTEAQLSCTK